MRILHVLTRFRRAGTERNVVHTALWERSHGHDVHLAVGRDSLVEGIPEFLTVHVVDSLVRSVSPVADARAFLALRGLISDLNIDIVHTHQSKAGIVGRLAARSRARGALHTIHMASFGPAYGRIASPLFLAAERLCARSTLVIVSVGDELRRVYLDAGVGDPAQYLVIRSPVDIAALALARSMSSDDRVARRARLGLSSEGRLAVTVSALEPRKRVSLIVRELAPLLRAGGLTLAIAGDGPERDGIARLGAELAVGDSVRLLGHVDDVPGLLAAADVTVHAATVEGVPQVVIQSLAVGIPVVATEMIGLREIPGAPIVTVPADGLGLGAAVAGVLGNPPPAVPLEAFRPWTTDGVDEGLADLHERLRGAASAIVPDPP